VDLQEKRQLDVVGQMARARARARPWRSIIALVLALAGAVAVQGWGRPLSAGAVHHAVGVVIVYSGTAAFFLFGTIAAFGLSGKARSVLQPVIGSAHAAVVRYALVLASAIAIILITLSLVNISVGRLVLGGALTGVLLGIAAQQSLANLFAGLMLMFARPFNVGDQVRIRSGALAGIIEGTVTEISITYVRLDTGDGTVFLPNSQVLAAAVGPIGQVAGQPAGQVAGQAAGQPAGQVDGKLTGQGGPSAAQPASPASGQPGGPA
jgi:small-conductance mechanosensitive channel